MKKEYVAPVAEVIAFDDVVLAAISLSSEDNNSYHAGAIINFSNNS